MLYLLRTSKNKLQNKAIFVKNVIEIPQKIIKTLLVPWKDCLRICKQHDVRVPFDRVLDAASRDEVLKSMSPLNGI